MKLFNIFKKENKSNAKLKVQNLDKKQLQKVIGGAETSLIGHEAAHVPQEKTN